MIKVENLSYTYADGTEAVKAVSIDFPEEHVFAVMGMSGSGKTTLLNCMARFIFPQKGQITIDGKNILGMEEKVFRQRLGVIFQDLNLFPHMTVLENMTLAPCRVQERDKKSAEKDASEMLEKLGISELADNYPAQISGGQAQRVAIARGLMLKPEVMLLDEPTSALDARTTSEFAEWLTELKSDTSFVTVTHDLPFSKQVAQRGVFMSEGEIVADGAIAEILKHIRTEV